MSNDAAGVMLEVEGPVAAVDSLVAALSAAPPLARVDAVTCTSIPAIGDAGSERAFVIRESGLGGARTALISPDTATCDDCWREFRDPHDRRYRHPFINCTSCGPRYSIVESVPYDRSRTTMASLPMCALCAAEYADPANRRFHAEPVCCPSCGPQLRLVGASGSGASGSGTPGSDPIAGAVAVLRSGGVLAVKGLGGYHLAADACSGAAVALLRSRKHREDRPFALMVAAVEDAGALCDVNPAELELLTSPQRPIVILPRKTSGLGGSVAPSVAPGAPNLGVMLAYTPLHMLLLEAFGGPLVMTSGNVSDEPIAFRDDDALARLGAVADAFLLHDRGIRTRVDDSVVRVVAGRVMPIRRSRGYVPHPIPLPSLSHAASSEVVLGMGASLKNTFCIARGRQAFLSHHIGDLDNYATFKSYVDGIDHLCKLLDVKPTVIAHDLHPDFMSTKHAADLGDYFGAELIGVQHHHAHIASCLIDNAGPDAPASHVIGVALDGFGLGCDGQAWGGEFFVGSLEDGFERITHLEEVPMPGGDAATREPWRMALAWLDKAYDGHIPSELDVVQRNRERWDQVLSLARSGVNSPPTSSAGRLFDAVASILGLGDVVTYEGQAAIELEYLASSVAAPAHLDEQVHPRALIRALTDDLLDYRPIADLASRFHGAMAEFIVARCRELREQHGLETVALSGGVFQNALLLSRSIERLEADEFTVVTHRQVPANDGGLSLGQVGSAMRVIR